MANEEKGPTPAPVPNDEPIAKIEAVVRRVMREEMGSLVVPNGYERCAVCGDLVKHGRPCPGCAERVKDKEKKEPDFFEKLGF